MDQEVLEELCQVKRVDRREENVPGETVAVWGLSEAVGEFEKEEEEEEVLVHETGKGCDHDGSFTSYSVPQSIEIELFGRHNELEDAVEDDVKNEEGKGYDHDGSFTSYSGTEVDFNIGSPMEYDEKEEMSEDEWISYVETSLEISVIDDVAKDKEMTEQGCVEKVCETEVENYAQSNMLLENILETTIEEQEVRREIFGGQDSNEDDLDEYISDDIIGGAKKTLGKNNYNKVFHLNEKEWFWNTSGSEQDFDTPEDLVDTFEEKYAKEMEPEDSELTEEEWFAEVCETELDKDSLASEVLEDILAMVLNEQDVLNISMFALADGDETEEESEAETESSEEEDTDSEEEDNGISSAQTAFQTKYSKKMGESGEWNDAVEKRVDMNIKYVARKSVKDGGKTDSSLKNATISTTTTTTASPSTSPKRKTGQEGASLAKRVKKQLHQGCIKYFLSDTRNVQN